MRTTTPDSYIERTESYPPTSGTHEDPDPFPAEYCKHGNCPDDCPECDIEERDFEIRFRAAHQIGCDERRWPSIEEQQAYWQRKEQ